MLRAEVLFPRSELLDSFDLARDEQELHERLDQIDSADEMSEETGVGNETRDDLANLRERLAREARAAEGRLRRKQQLASEDLERTGPAAERRMEMAALDVARQFDDATEQAESWGRTLGGSGEASAARSLELGRQLGIALDVLADSRFRKGDIVFVTDGQAQIGEAWRESFLAEKKRLDFSLYSILIDVGGSALETLRPISYRISSIRELSDEGVTDLFVRV